MTNPDHVSVVPKPDIRTEAMKAERMFLKPDTDNPRSYINPLLGVSNTFFSKVDVLVDGTHIDMPSLENMGYVYQTFNRTFTTEKLRDKWFGTGTRRVSDSVDGSTYLGTTGSPNFMSILKESSFNKRYNATDKLMVGSFDGIWPHSCQNAQLAQIFGEHRSGSPWLGPRSEVIYRLHRRFDMDSCLERAEIDAATYYDEDEAATDFPELQIELIDVQIRYESMTIKDPAQLAKMTKSTPTTFLTDVPKIVLKSLPSGLSYHAERFSLPVGTRLVALMWLHDHQIYFSKSSKKNLSGHMKFPKNAVDVNISISGHEGILFEDGLKNFGIDERIVSNSCASYHSYLTSMKLYDKDLSSLFPRQPMQSYDQVGEYSRYQINCRSSLSGDFSSYSLYLSLSLSHTADAAKKTRLR